MFNRIINIMFSDYFMVILSVLTLIVANTSLSVMLLAKKRKNKYENYLNENYNMIFRRRYDKDEFEKIFKELLNFIIGDDAKIQVYRTKADLDYDIDFHYDLILSNYNKPKFLIFTKHFRYHIELIKYGRISLNIKIGEKKEKEVERNLYILNIEHNSGRDIHITIIPKKRLSMNDIDHIKQLSEKYCDEVLNNTRRYIKRNTEYNAYYNDYFD